MNRRELVDAAIAHSNLLGVEGWKPPADDPQTLSSVSNCISPSFPGLGDPWQPAITPVLVPATVEKAPDFEAKVWKAVNGFMFEVRGEKYVAKDAKEMAQLFLKAFEEEL